MIDYPKEIQNILNDFDQFNGLHESQFLITEMKKLITPKPEFIKGEIVEVNNDGEWFLRFFEEKVGSAFYGSNVSGMVSSWKYCRKISSLPIALIPHNSPYRPEGLKDDDVVLVRWKTSPNSYATTYKVHSINWEEVKGYMPVHFLTKGTIFTNCTQHTVKEKCEHDWVYEGYGHNFSNYKCTKCDETEEW